MGPIMVIRSHQSGLPLDAPRGNRSDRDQLYVRGQLNLAWSIDKNG